MPDKQYEVAPAASSGLATWGSMCAPFAPCGAGWRGNAWTGPSARITSQGRPGCSSCVACAMRDGCCAHAIHARCWSCPRAGRSCISAWAWMRQRCAARPNTVMPRAVAHCPAKASTSGRRASSASRERMPPDVGSTLSSWIRLANTYVLSPFLAQPTNQP